MAPTDVSSWEEEGDLQIFDALPFSFVAVSGCVRRGSRALRSPDVPILGCQKSLSASLLCHPSL